MLITKDKPVGIDAYVHQMQAHLHAKLSATWSLSDTAYACYGRVYRNVIDKGYVAEAYEAKNEYKEVYWDNTKSVVSFFGLSNNIKSGVTSTADVHLVFFANLQKIKQNIAHRADEEVRQDVTSIVGKGLFGFSFQSIDLWLDNVLREYPGSRRDERLKAVDMHPVHCFRLNFKLTFNPQKNCLTTSIK